MCSPNINALHHYRWSAGMPAGALCVGRNFIAIAVRLLNRVESNRERNRLVRFPPLLYPICRRKMGAFPSLARGVINDGALTSECLQRPVYFINVVRECEVERKNNDYSSECADVSRAQYFWTTG